MNISDTSGSGITLPWQKRKEPVAGEERKGKRIPGLGFMPNKVRNHFIAMVGEFIGTFLFLFIAFAGTQVANAGAAAVTNGSAGQSDTGLAQAPLPQVLMYISLVFGFSLAVNAWVFFRISGGLFNPAVTFGLAAIGGITWTRAGLVFIAELLGAMSSAGVVACLFPGPLAVTTTLHTGTSIVRGLFIEMFLTAILVFTIFMLAAEKHKGTYLAPVGIGLALFVCELAGVFYTGGSLNPARSFGPCVVTSFPHYHWIYWLGPFLGSLLAVGFYRFIKALEYETANPGQDFNEKETEAFEFDEDTADTAEDVSRPTPGMIEQRSSSQLNANHIPGRGRVSSANSSTLAKPEDPTFATYQNAVVAEEGLMHRKGELATGARPTSSGSMGVKPTSSGSTGAKKI